MVGFASPSVGTRLSVAFLTDSQAAPTSGTAAFRVFNGATSAGTVDVYVTASDTALADASATASSVSGPSLGSYVEIGKGTYRIRVTGAGDKTDVRLDIPAVTLADQQIATLVLTATSGGVLVNGLVLNQKGSLSAYNNTSARVRLVAALSGNTNVSASTTDSALNATLQSPTVGSYVSTDASLAGLVLTVNGTSLDASGLSVAAGSDVTLLVYGDAASPQLKLLIDDNTPATLSTNTKLRLVNVLSGLGSGVSLSADYVAVADNVAYGTASSPASLTASTTMRLEATSPLRATSLYLATDVTLAAQKVYTLFLMGDASAPLATLRRDR